MRELAAFDFERAEMHSDMDEWLSTLEAVHPNPFTKIERAAFLARFEDEKAALPATADPFEFYAALQRLASLLGDSRTAFSPPTESRAHRDRRWPLETLVRDGRLFVATRFDRLEKGSEVLAVNRIAASRLLESATALSNAELPETARALAPSSLWLALWLSGERAPFRVEVRSPSGKHEVVVLEGLAPSNNDRPSNAEPGREDESQRGRYGLTWLEPGVARINVVSLDDYSYFQLFIGEAIAELVKRKARGLIIDLRAHENGSVVLGGSLLERITNKPFLFVSEVRWRVSRENQAYLADRQGPGWKYHSATPGTMLREAGTLWQPDGSPKRYTGPVCFLIGPRTLSAGMVVANAVEDFDLGMLIGEPTAFPPNHFDMPYVFQLPSTKLEARIAAAQFVRANGDASNPRPVMPDIVLAPTFEQWRRGEDPVLARAVEWVKTGR